MTENTENIIVFPRPCTICDDRENVVPYLNIWACELCRTALLLTTVPNPTVKPYQCIGATINEYGNLECMSVEFGVGDMVEVFDGINWETTRIIYHNQCYQSESGKPLIDRVIRKY